MEQTSDRMGFALFVAGILHVALILGVGFSSAIPGPRARSLEITLATYRHDKTVEDADYLAQFNQLGSGEQEQAEELSTPITSPLDDRSIRTSQAEPSGQPSDTRLEQSTVVTTEGRQQAMDRKPQPDSELLPSADSQARALSNEELASLTAKLDKLQRQYSKRPRVHRLTSVSARQSVDAAYLHAWKARIEAIGNQNYPLEARRRRLFGDLRLLVAVRQDGTVEEIRVLQSSGERLLDDAAQRIVRMAAPFDPFPRELRERADVIEIIRTWQFRQGRVSARR